MPDIPLRRRTPEERRAYLESKRGEVPDDILDAVIEAGDHTGPATELRIVVAEAVRFRPGDRVLLTTNASARWDADTLRSADKVLHERFPGVEFTFLYGIEQVSVAEAGPRQP